jgi:hypothetical protein
VTVVAFTDAGRMRRLQISKRFLLAVACFVCLWIVGSTAAMLGFFRGQVDMARMVFLERENRSLASLLEKQAEQLSRLKVEVARLKEFERSLRVVSGMDAPRPEAPAAAGQPPGGASRKDLTKRR